MSSKKLKRVARTVIVAGSYLLAGPVALSQEGAGPAAFQTQAAPRLDAFVNWDYRHRQKLRGWRNTAQVIARTLAEWFPGGGTKIAIIENGSPVELKAFLGGLPAAGGAPFDLVYLAAHQSPAGDWEFTNREKISWRVLLDGVAVPSPGRRIVILDSCFAGSVPAGWGSRLGALALYASSAGEPATELHLNRRIPIDYRRDYPREVAWLEARFGKDWMRGDSRLSFLGFVWLRAFLQTMDAPRTSADWEHFFKRCESEAALLRNGKGRRLAASVRMERQ